MQPLLLRATVAVYGRSVLRHVRGIASNSNSPFLNNREKNVVYSPFPKVELPKESIPDLIFKTATKYSNIDAIECGVTGRKYTYGGMMDRALRWGAVVNQVMPPSSTFRNLLLFSQNVPEFPIILLGTQAVGAMITTMNHTFTVDEVVRQTRDCGAQMVVVDPKLEKVVRTAFDKLKISLPLFVNGVSEYGSPNLREIIENDSKPFAEPIEIPGESIAAMLYSSGTTGKPKGVALSHRAFTANMAMFTQPNSVSPFRPTTEDYQEKVTGVFPFYHMSGTLIITLYALYHGAKIISLPAFTPQDYIRIVKDHKVEILHLVPPLLNLLAKSPTITSDDLARIRYAMCGAAPVPASNAFALKEKAKNLVMFLEGFGMTEALTTHSTPLNQEKIGSCGQLISNTEGKVIDLSTGEALPEGQRGELCIRSPSLMSYYHNNPEATAEAIDSEGWLQTGDVVVHKDGFFSIVDRKKELIKVKGYQVSPSELEEVLLKHPGVMDVGVVGVEDERAGELPRAYVVRRPGTTAKELMDYTQAKVAPYKQLQGGIIFVETLPKNPTGKLLRRQLKEMAANGL